MPELPEVETLKTQIKESFLGKTLLEARIIDGRASSSPERLIWLKGKKLANVSRRGKTLILQFGKNHTALVHLMISGRAFLIDTGEGVPKGCMVCLVFDNKSLCFTYLHLGFIEVYKTGDTTHRLDHYGPEALDISVIEFVAGLSSSRKSIKAVLLDQRMIAGIGNIYADEILYCAKVNPSRTSNLLTKKEIERLYLCINRLLKKAIQKRGTTIVSWEDLYGNKGEFQNCLKVVDKEGEICTRCRSKILKTKVAGRATYLCPSCQK